MRSNVYVSLPDREQKKEFDMAVKKILTEDGNEDFLINTITYGFCDLPPDDLYILSDEIDVYSPHAEVPLSKIENAFKYYPVDRDDTPLILIDTTLFGSAKTGVLIGKNGVYWENDWTTDSAKKKLSWGELVYLYNENEECISAYETNLFFNDDCVLNMAGSSMKREDLEKALRRIVSALLTDIRLSYLAGSDSEFDESEDKEEFDWEKIKDSYANAFINDGQDNNLGIIPSVAEPASDIDKLKLELELKKLELEKLELELRIKSLADA